MRREETAAMLAESVAYTGQLCQPCSHGEGTKRSLRGRDCDAKNARDRDAARFSDSPALPCPGSGGWSRLDIELECTRLGCTSLQCTRLAAFVS